MCCESEPWRYSSGFLGLPSERQPTVSWHWLWEDSRPKTAVNSIQNSRRSPELCGQIGLCSRRQIGNCVWLAASCLFPQRNLFLPGMSTLAQTNATWSANVEVCFQPNLREAGKSPAALQDRAMVGRIAPIRVISFLLLAACEALCQSDRSVDLLQFDGSNSPVVQCQEMRTWRLLPEAPSVRPPTQAEKFHTFVAEARSPLTLGSVGVNARVMHETELGHVTRGPQPSLTALY